MATEQPRPNALGVRVCVECMRRWGTDAWSNDCGHFAGGRDGDNTTLSEEHREIWAAIDAYEDGELGNRQPLKDAVDTAIACVEAEERKACYTIIEAARQLDARLAEASRMRANGGFEGDNIDRWLTAVDMMTRPVFAAALDALEVARRSRGTV